MDDEFYDYEIPVTDEEIAASVARVQAGLSESPEARSARIAAAEWKYQRALAVQVELRLAEERLAEVARWN
jgi:hypothetical protein